MAHSTTRWMKSALPGAAAATPSSSSRASCCRKTGPWPHGPVLHTVSPAKPRVAGASWRARQPARSAPRSSARCRCAGEVHHLGTGGEGVDGLGHEPFVVGPPGRLDLPFPRRPRGLRLGPGSAGRCGRGPGWRTGTPAPGARRPGRSRPSVGQCPENSCSAEADRGAGPGAHRVTVPGVPDGVPHHLAQRQRAVPLQQQHPGPERGGHAGRQQPVAGHQVKPQPPERPQRGTARRRSLAVQHEHLAVPRPAARPAGVVADHRDLAAEPVHVRLDDLEHQAGGDGGVEGVAAGLQRGHAGRGGQPVGGRHHAEGARELRPGGERGALRHHRRSLGCRRCGGSAAGWCGGVAPAGTGSPVPSSSRGQAARQRRGPGRAGPARPGRPHATSTGGRAS